MMSTCCVVCRNDGLYHVDTVVDDDGLEWHWRKVHTATVDDFEILKSYHAPTVLKSRLDVYDGGNEGYKGTIVPVDSIIYNTLPWRDAVNGIKGEGAAELTHVAIYSPSLRFDSLVLLKVANNINKISTYDYARGIKGRREQHQYHEQLSAKPIYYSVSSIKT